MSSKVVGGKGCGRGIRSEEYPTAEDERDGVVDGVVTEDVQAEVMVESV